MFEGIRGAPPVTLSNALVALARDSGAQFRATCQTQHVLGEFLGRAVRAQERGFPVNSVLSMSSDVGGGESRSAQHGLGGRQGPAFGMCWSDKDGRLVV